MYYEISEDEFYSLESARNQLNLIAGLVANADTNGCLSLITGRELYAFVDAQQATVSRVIEAAREREIQASAKRREEEAVPKAPQVLISPELLIGLVDAARGDLPTSEELIKLSDSLCDAGVIHPPYMDAFKHFINVMRSRGLVMSFHVIDGCSSREFVPAPEVVQTRGATPAKPRRRESLARVGA